MSEDIVSFLSGSIIEVPVVACIELGAILS